MLACVSACAVTRAAVGSSITDMCDRSCTHSMVILHGPSGCGELRPACASAGGVMPKADIVRLE
eukprot:2470879-Rhodomonas_salina.1